MNVHKIPAGHIAARIVAAMKAADDAGELIASISVSDAEFAQLLGDETVKNTTSKWYGSNEGGMVITNIKTQMLDVNGVSTPVPVSCYFNGIKIVRG